MLSNSNQEGELFPSQINSYSPPPGYQMVRPLPFFSLTQPTGTLSSRPVISTIYYSSSTFPGLANAMFEIDEDPNQEGQVVKENMAIVAYIIQSAANGLTDAGDIL